MTTALSDPGRRIAVVGMAGRFPGAANIEEFWDNLLAGRETTKRFTAEDLTASNLPTELLNNPCYVPVRGVLDAVHAFDAAFFSYTPREAELLDPQQRVFLECAWSALEDAGYDPRRCGEGTGVFATTNQNTYLLFHLLNSVEALTNVHGLAMHGDKDFIATRVSHKLNLKGPSYTLQCACSSSLVCIHAACQSLLAMECDMALAGGASVVFPQAGYMYQEGGVYSPDGHCRAFDAKAAGTFGSDGSAVVVLKRLEDALRDRDHIYATILGSAINNDGTDKPSYAAPSVDGQVRVIAEALAVADVEPDSVGYIETHGTGTPLGDPIEISALTRAYRSASPRPAGCAIGSLKPNMGHLDHAAGVASFIKAALVVQRGLVPPSLNFETPNPQIDFGPSLRVNTQLMPWSEPAGPRRAGVSSFGFGGTNAHVIVEEPPRPPVENAAEDWHILPLSGQTPTALERSAGRLSDWLALHEDTPLRSVARVLQTGRAELPKRACVLARTHADAHAALIGKGGKVIYGATSGSTPPVCFMFPGQGAQRVGMARDLYRRERVVRDVIDAGTKLLPDIGDEIRRLIVELPDDDAAAQVALARTKHAQPAMFLVEYALAQLWRDYGVTPSAAIGHSLGEWVCATLAGVFEFSDALRLVALRGRLMDALPAGAMVAVSAPLDDVVSFIRDGISLAAENAVQECVLSGDFESIAALEAALTSRRIDFRRLRTSHAFHSAMMTPMTAELARAVEKTSRSAPQMPFFSNVTGTWITAAQATDPAYWSEHVCRPVLFAKGLAAIDEQSPVYVEVGPGHVLTGLARSLLASAKRVVVPSLRRARDAHDDRHAMLSAAATLWAHGVPLCWDAIADNRNAYRASLPSYPFERVAYFVPPRRLDAAMPEADSPMRQPADRWAYIPSWERAPAFAAESIPPERRCLVLAGDIALGRALATACADRGLATRVAVRQETFGCDPDGVYRLDLEQVDQVKRLLEELGAANGRLTDIVVALQSTTPLSDLPPAAVMSQTGLSAILTLAKAAAHLLPQLALTVVTIGAEDVTGCEALLPSNAAVLGACRAIPHELIGWSCRTIDLSPGADWPGSAHRIAAELGRTLDASEAVALRDGHVYRLRYAQAKMPPIGATARLSEGDVVFITGGRGEIGLTNAEYLAGKHRVRLVLFARTPVNLDKSSGRTRAEQRIAALIAAGVEVCLVDGNVADLADVRRAFATARDRFGRIDVVVHAAGLSGESVFKSVNDTTAGDLASHFGAKVEGLRTLATVIADYPSVRQCLLQSSILTALGGAGATAYVAAAAVMDREAIWLSRRARATQWLSVGWDIWLPADSTAKSVPPVALAAQEAGQTFERFLGLAGTGHVLVSTFALNERIEHSRRRPSDQVRAEASAAGGATVYQRPALDTPYAAPNSEIEKALAAMWQQLLGIESIGIDDDFFELGGHSLLATQVVSQVREHFPIECSLQDLVDQPTVGKLAALVETRLLEKIDNLSEAEAKQLAGISEP